MKKIYLRQFDNAHRKGYQKGFTATEILAVIAIVIIMTTIGIMAIASSRQQRQVATVADKTKGIILETRSFAVTKPVNLKDAKYIIIKIDKVTNAITFYKTLADSSQVPIPALVSDINIPSNVTFKYYYTVTIDASTPNSLGSMAVAGSEWAFLNKGPKLGIFNLFENAKAMVGPPPGTTNEITVSQGNVSYQLVFSPNGGNGGIDIVKL